MGCKLIYLLVFYHKSLQPLFNCIHHQICQVRFFLEILTITFEYMNIKRIRKLCIVVYLDEGLFSKMYAVLNVCDILLQYLPTLIHWPVQIHR